MLDSLDNHACQDVCGTVWKGLRAKLQEHNYTHCVILAGTNDVGGRRCPAEGIFNNIVKLAAVANGHGCKTFVMTIPELLYERHDANMAHIRAHANHLLMQSEWFFNTIDLSPVVPYHRLHDAERDRIWEPDGLHLRPLGYDNIGKAVAARLHFAKLDAMPKNDEGNPVKLGDDDYPGYKGSDKYYCGQIRAIPGSDGLCGPTSGPQCGSCLRFQHGEPAPTAGADAPRALSTPDVQLVVDAAGSAALTKVASPHPAAAEGPCAAQRSLPSAPDALSCPHGRLAWGEHDRQSAAVAAVEARATRDPCGGGGQRKMGNLHFLGNTSAVQYPRPSSIPQRAVSQATAATGAAAHEVGTQEEEEEDKDETEFVRLLRQDAATALDLSSQGLGDDEAISMASALLSNTSLVSLDLSANDVAGSSFFVLYIDTSPHNRSHCCSHVQTQVQARWANTRTYTHTHTQTHRHTQTQTHTHTHTHRHTHTQTDRHTHTHTHTRTWCRRRCKRAERCVAAQFHAVFARPAGQCYRRRWCVLILLN
jgi:hypothetical protein